MWRRGEGRVKRKTYYLSRDAEPRRSLQPFPPETEEAGEEEAENAEEEVARRARLARGAGRTAAGAAPGRGAGRAAVVVRKRSLIQKSLALEEMAVWLSENTNAEMRKPRKMS